MTEGCFRVDDGKAKTLCFSIIDKLRPAFVRGGPPFVTLVQNITAAGVCCDRERMPVCD